MIIHSWNRHSRGANAIRKGLKKAGVKVWFSWRGAPPKPGTWIINWGDSDADFLNRHERVLNRPSDLRLMTNKLRFFQHCVDGVVPWTTDKKQAGRWEYGYARTILEGSGGAGIVVFDKNHGELPDARLYTKRVFPAAEYRIHVGRNPSGEVEVLDTQRKVFQKSSENPAPKSWAIRSHDNGFVFVRNSPPNKRVIDTVLKFHEKFPSLSFCAYDVIVDKNDKTFVLEGNTAPGLEGQTVSTYVKFFKQFKDNKIAV